MKTRMLALLVSLGLTGVLHADNWPQWRGPAASGTSTETGLPERWSDTEKHRLLVYYNGLLYMAGDVGVLSAMDAKTGQRVWQERTGGVFTASPVAADGKIYMLGEDGQTIVLAAGPTPRVLARNRLNARQLASPAISGGRLHIRTDDAVIAVGK